MAVGGVQKTVFVTDAARLLGVSRRTVYYRIREGKLQTVRTACGTQRVVIDSIVALLRESLAPAASTADRPQPSVRKPTDLGVSG
jgi:excisionase family DNA binding protein